VLNTGFEHLSRKDRHAMAEDNLSTTLKFDLEMMVGPAY
jgi:hypothetical protein